jgi:hypothetical protein
MHLGADIKDFSSTTCMTETSVSVTAVVRAAETMMPAPWLILPPPLLMLFDQQHIALEAIGFDGTVCAIHSAHC